MKNTILDIASIAGVSPATVSKALNGRKGVSEYTKQKIFNIAKEKGYQKDNNRIQKSIRFVIFKKHGLVVSDTPFFSSLIEGIEKESRTQGYETLITHVCTNDVDFKETIDGIKNDYCDGMLILATEMNFEDIGVINNINIPIVIVDNYINGKNYDSILINNTDAAFKATEFLIKNGHTRIGYLHSSIFINNFHYRKIGYLDALRENNLNANEQHEFLLEPTMEGSYRDMKKLLEQNTIELPTAFFADNDIIAFGAIKALKEKGIKIPKDVSIVGFDDMPFCEITNPSLTTIRVFKQELGSIAVKRLIEKINSNDSITQKIEVNTELIIRNSVRKTI